jgi:hypothetical protein
MAFPDRRLAGAPRTPDLAGAPRLPDLPELARGRIRLGGGLAEAAALPRLATGLGEVDRLLGGGFPRGRLSEITGPPGSGRTSLALTLAATALAAGELVAWVDAADALDPASLEERAVDPSRLLWVRAPGVPEALRSAERLLVAGGFALVVLDLLTQGRSHPDAHVWMRLARAASASGTALALLGRERRVGPFATLVVDLRAARVHFAAKPAWLEGLTSRVELVRHRLGVAEGFVPVCWKVPPVVPDAPARRSRNPDAA